MRELDQKLLDFGITESFDENDNPPFKERDSKIFKNFTH